MTKIQIVKIANSLEMFCPARVGLFFLICPMDSFIVACHFPMDAFGRNLCQKKQQFK